MSALPRIKVAISSDFLTAFSKIPRNKQSKVTEFINKFRSDPMSSGINYEKIQNAADDNLRSVRIDQAYRGVVLKPERGNVYVLLWVDHHDRAYQWAEGKTVSVHPETGSLQVLDVQEAEAAAVRQEPKTRIPGIFDQYHDRHLLRLGIPAILMPLVRNIRTEQDLDAASEHFPQEAYEGLFLLAAGYSLDEVFADMETAKEPEPVDPEDFEAALEKPDSQRRFWVVEDDLELAAILEAPLEKWRVFLHPSQRSLVERDWNGPVRVLGGAGTGKTVVAIHRARWLAERAFTSPNDRILFTTFTRNLAADIQDNLTKICTEPAVLRRIEVVNLDRWVSNYLRRHGYEYQIDYGSRTDALWQQALAMAPPDLGLSEDFYHEEWQRVIQPQEVHSLTDYFKASRIGRGTPLHRKSRKRAWPVFEEYRLLLNEHRLREAEDAMCDARKLVEDNPGTLPYKSVVVDEAQDMGPQAYRLIRALIPEERKNDLFIVGDAHQRIYRHRVVLSHCGINIRGRGRRLRINYRTTDETRRWAVRLLKGIDIDDLDGGIDDQRGYKSLLHGLSPTVRKFDSFHDEVEFIENYLRHLAQQGEALNGVCLVARTRPLLQQYEAALQEKGFEVYLIRRSVAEDRCAPGVRLATMHRVKGLEFPKMIIASVNDAMVPLETGELHSPDTTVRFESEARERALLYVAATRATREVLVTSFGKPSQYLVR